LKPPFNRGAVLAGGENELKAMVLAAGRGDRMRPLTDALPKPLLPVAGRPLVAHQLLALAAAGIREVVMNCAWQSDRLQQALGDGGQWGVSIRYSPEPWPALETGGGIFQALPLLGPGPFLLVNGDVWSDFDPAALELPEGMLAHLLLVPNPEHNPAGDFSLRSGLVGTADRPRYTYGGMAVLSPDLFAGCKAGCFPLAPLLVGAAERSRVSGVLHEGGWIDVGTPERLYALRARLGEA
jgi:N-acetyl-alpha-D-muramate 1-phosphate uridylyltransferase